MSLAGTFWFEAKIFKIVDTVPRNISIKSFYSDSTIVKVNNFVMITQLANYFQFGTWAVYLKNVFQ